MNEPHYGAFPAQLYPEISKHEFTKIYYTSAFTGAY